MYPSVKAMNQKILQEFNTKNNLIPNIRNGKSYLSIILYIPVLFLSYDDGMLLKKFKNS